MAPCAEGLWPFSPLRRLSAARPGQNAVCGTDRLLELTATDVIEVTGNDIIAILEPGLGASPNSNGSCAQTAGIEFGTLDETQIGYMNR